MPGTFGLSDESAHVLDASGIGFAGHTIILNAARLERFALRCFGAGCHCGSRPSGKSACRHCLCMVANHELAATLSILDCIFSAATEPPTIRKLPKPAAVAATPHSPTIGSFDRGNQSRSSFPVDVETFLAFRRGLLKDSLPSIACRIERGPAAKDMVIPRTTITDLQRSNQSSRLNSESRTLGRYFTMRDFSTGSFDLLRKRS